MKIKILHFIPTLEGGGAERQLVMLALEQSKHGFEVHIAARRAGIYESFLQDTQVIFHHLGDYRGLDPRLVLKAKKLVSSIKPNLIQSWLPQMDVLGGLLALWASVPWVISERTSPVHYQKRSLINSFRQFLAQYASHIVANSSDSVAYWCTKFPEHSIVKINNAIDKKAIHALVSNAVENSNRELKRILVVGRLAEEKSIETIIQAFALLRADSSLHLSIVGDGPLHSEIERMIQSLNLGHCCSLLPFQVQWWSLLKGASVLINMSRYEGQPNVVLETIAAGIPVIVSDIPAHREFLDNESAILVPCNNLSVLAEAISSVLADPSSAHQRALRASEHINNLTVQAAAEAYAAVYQKALS